MEIAKPAQEKKTTVSPSAGGEKKESAFFSEASKVYEIPRTEFGENLVTQIGNLGGYDEDVIDSFNDVRNGIDKWLTTFSPIDKEGKDPLRSDKYAINEKDFWDAVKSEMSKENLNYNQRKEFSRLVATALSTAIGSSVKIPEGVAVAP